jgi:hypothetical protein
MHVVSVASKEVGGAAAPSGRYAPRKAPIMVKFMSPEQILANQKNAQKSTGPRTPEGKQASSRNGIKHGLLARDVVLSGPTAAEDRADFDALLADLCEELDPRGFIEQALVERIATCYWRLHRVQRFENGAIREILESPHKDEDNVDFYEKRLSAEEKRLAVMDRLTELFIKQLSDLTAEEKQEIVTLVEQLPPPCPPLLRDLLPPLNPDDLRKRLPAMRIEQQQTVERLGIQCRLAQEQSQLRETRQTLIGSLPNDANLLKLIRYETMLDRQIHRALSELRRLRERGGLSPDH